MSATSPASSAGAPQYVEVSPEPDALVWVIISLYLLGLLGLAAYSWTKNLSSESTTEAMRDHFLANQKIGDVVLMFTVFSTTFSGYTVVGVPEEMYRYGFFSYRWLFTVLPITVLFHFVGARLNFLSKVRSYISPTAFIGDRYNSHMLKVAISLTLIYPTFIYVLSQFKSMSSTVEGLSNSKIDGFLGACVLCAIMILYEIFGGLRAIAWTDTVQGIVMTIGFLIFFIVQAEIFDGVESAGNYMRDIGMNTVLPQDLRTRWFSFGTTIFFAFVFYPHMIQRFQGAASHDTFRKSMIFLTFGTWLAMTSSLCTGMVAMHYFGFRNPNIGENEVYGATLRYVISKGFGWNLFGSILFCSSLAAFMSTADSAINGASCCFSLDILQPFPHLWKCNPDATWSKREMLIWSKVISVIVAVGALLTDKYVDYELGELLEMQNAVLSQVFPAYFFGMVLDFVQPYAVLIGWAFGVITTITVQCDNDADDCLRSGIDWYWPVENLHPSMFALLVNIGIVILLSLLFEGRRFSWDEIKPNHYYPNELVGLDITGTTRPYHWPNCIIYVLILVASIFAVPWWQGTEDGDKETFTDGLPSYIRDGYWFTGVASALTLIALTVSWKGEPDIGAQIEKLEVAAENRQKTLENSDVKQEIELHTKEKTEDFGGNSI